MEKANTENIVGEQAAPPQATVAAASESSVLRPLIQTRAKLPLEKQHWTMYLIFCTVSVIMGSSFMFGYNGGVINAPFIVMSTYVNESLEREGQILSKHDFSFMWATVVSLHLIGGIIGSIWFPTALIRPLGRKNALLVAASIGVLGASCSFVTPWTRSHVPLMIGRLVVGFANGLSMVLTPGLITDIAPANLRGQLGSAFSLGVPLGVTCANLLGLPQLLGSPSTWQYLFLFVAALYAVHFFCLLFVVESPKVLIDHKKEDEALKALMKLRDATEQEVRAEFERDKVSATRHHPVHRIPWADYAKLPHLYWPLIIVINLHIANVLTGQGAAFYYATKVMKEAGLDVYAAAAANFAISFGSIIGNIFNITFVDRFGRRPLILAGLVLVGCANIMLTVVIQLQVVQVSTVAFAIFLFAFAIGPGPIPFFMSAELTARTARSLTLIIGMITNWAGVLFVSLFFPAIQFRIGAFSFLPFAVVSFVEFLFFLLFLPETSRRLVRHFYPEDEFAPGRSLLRVNSTKNKNAAAAAAASADITLAHQTTTTSTESAPIQKRPPLEEEEEEDEEELQEHQEEKL